MTAAVDTLPTARAPPLLSLVCADSLSDFSLLFAQPMGSARVESLQALEKPAEAFLKHTSSNDLMEGMLMRPQKLLALTLCLSLLAGPALAQSARPLPAGPQCLRPIPDVDPRRSIFVTEVDVVQNAISLEEVLSQLASESGIAGLEPIDLWQQWWDTQNTSPGLGLGVHCDTFTDAQGQPTLNGFPIECPRSEGSEISVDPFDPGLPSFYEPIALVNRMDLMPEDGSNCGEFRMIFARNSGATNRLNRNLIIFEAVLPNPNPSCEAAGCRAVAEFWARLSRIQSPASRARLLRAFYLNGLPREDVEPVIRIGHFSPGSGQIRTNQFMNSGGSFVNWQLREYKLVQFCASEQDLCSLQFMPVSVKTNPWGELFDDTPITLQKRDFMSEFVSQIEALSEPDLNRFFNQISNRFNAGQSNSQGSENDYVSHFNPTGPFASAIGRQLRNLGSELQPIEIIRRSQTQSCAGCHQLSNQAPDNLLGDGLIWPPSLGFVHVAEDQTETIGGREHFSISQALQRTFIPHREEVFEQYLADMSCENCRTEPLVAMPTSTVPIVEVNIASDSLELETPTPEDVERLDELLKELNGDRLKKTLGGPRLSH